MTKPMQFQALNVHGHGYIHFNAKSVTTVQIIGSDDSDCWVFLTVPGHSEPLQVRAMDRDEANSILRWWKAWA